MAILSLLLIAIFYILVKINRTLTELSVYLSSPSQYEDLWDFFWEMTERDDPDDGEDDLFSWK